MIAVKYRADYLTLATPFNWPEKIRKGVESLPEGYDLLLADQLAYDTFLADNQAAFDAQKAAEAQALAAANLANNFQLIRDKWQKMADDFAASNVGLGIATADAAVIADGFETVEKYLRMNVPMKAIAEIDVVPTDATFLTLAKRDAMKAELLAYIQEVFGI